MDKTLIQKKTRELLEKAEKPEEFTKGLQGILESCTDKDASSSYRKLIPEMGRAFGTPKPILVIIAGELGKYGQKNSSSIFSILIMTDEDKDVKKGVAWILRQISNKNSEEVVTFLIKWAKAKNKNAQWIIKDGMKKLSQNLQAILLKSL